MSRRMSPGRNRTSEIVGETERVRRQELSTTRDVDQDRTRVEDLQAQLERIRAQVLAVEDPTLEVEQNRLASAKQTLTEEMRRLLAEIQSGAFADEWMAECEAGKPEFKALEEAAAGHPLEEVGARIRPLMPWLAKDRLVDKARN